MKLKKTLMIASASVLALALGGCASNCIQIASGGNSSKDVATSNGTIQVISPSTALAGGNILRARVELQNNSSDQQSVKYKFQWYNGQGFNAGEDTPWQPLVINPNSSQVVSDVAPSSAATRFNVLVCKG